MATPTMPNLAEGPAEALGGTLDASTGIAYPTFGINEDSNPSLMSVLMNRFKQVLLHLASDSQGLVVSLDNGLNVGVYPMNYRIGATDCSYAGAASTAMTASSTNYLWLESDGTLHVNTTGWTAADQVRLAKVVTSSNAVTSITDMRYSNFQAGIVNAWSAVPASAQVAMAGFGLQQLGPLNLADATTLTLASDAITPTQFLHRVDTQAAAATDDLVNITLDAAAHRRRFLLIACVTPARVVTVKSTGNIKLKRGDAVLDDVDKLLLLVQLDASHWVEVSRNFQTISTLLNDLDVDGKMLSNLGVLNIKGVDATVVSNAITRTAAWHTIDSTPVPTLRTINGGVDGDVLIISTEGSALGGSLLVEAGTGNILLNADATLGSDFDFLVLFRSNGNWYQLTRSFVTNSLLAEAQLIVPYCIGAAHYPGALSNDQATWILRAAMPFKLRRARGRVVTAPSGASCVIDILKNGASVFPNDASAVNFAVGVTNATSALVDIDFVAGDELTVKVKTASSAVSATVSFEAYTAPKDPYT